MPVAILIYLQIPKTEERLVERSVYMKWIFLLIVWLIYGIILMNLSPYTDPHLGFIEVLSIFNGLICMYILVSIIRNHKDIEQIVTIVFYVYIALVMIGMAEIILGVHLPMSYFNDATITHIVGRTAATGVFYSENDFSTFLTSLAPLMIYRKKKRVLGLAALLGAIYINTINDANICVIAMVFGVAYYFVFIKKYGKRGQAVLRGLLIAIIAVAVIFVWRNIDTLKNSSRLLMAIRTQHLNARQSYGSLYARFMIYVDSLKASVNTYFLGIGPAAFTNYFKAHPSISGLVNPHNLYLEILVEYGGIIAGFFTVGLFKLIYQLRKKILKSVDRNTRRKLIAGCEMLVLYSISCIASSSFIGYSWQWIVISLGTILLGVSEINPIEEKAMGDYMLGMNYNSDKGTLLYEKGKK